MDKKALKSVLFSGLENILGPNGFQLKRNEDCFVRKFEGGELSISVALFGHAPTFQFTISAGVRLNDIEDAFHQFSGSPEKYRALSTTIISQLVYFTNGKRDVFAASSSEDVDAALAELAPVLLGQVLPTLHECTSVVGLESRVRLDPAFDSTRLPSSLMHALILSRLAGRADFDELADKAIRDGQQSAGPDFEKISLLVAHLRASR